LFDVLLRAMNGCGEETLCSPAAALQALGFTLWWMHVQDDQRE